MLDKLWPRLALNFTQATWRADRYLVLGFQCVPVVPRYFAAAPAWYRFWTWFWGGWNWVRT